MSIHNKVGGGGVLNFCQVNENELPSRMSSNHTQRLYYIFISIIFLYIKIVHFGAKSSSNPPNNVDVSDVTIEVTLYRTFSWMPHWYDIGKLCPWHHNHCTSQKSRDDSACVCMREQERYKVCQMLQQWHNFTCILSNLYQFQIRTASHVLHTKRQPMMLFQWWAAIYNKSFPLDYIMFFLLLTRLHWHHALVLSCSVNDDIISTPGKNNSLLWCHTA